MDEIIYLEPDEEITSVIDKMKQSKNARIALVVPREATLLQSVVNLRLLIREASRLQKEISLVTADKIGRNLASQVGLTVYDSIKSTRPIFQPEAPLPKAQEVIEIDMSEKPPEEIKPKGLQVHHFQAQEPRQKIAPVFKPAKIPKPPKEIDWKKWQKFLWPAAGMLVILALIGAFFLLPKVIVKIKVQAESFQKNLDASVTSDENNQSVDNNTYLGKLIDLKEEKQEKFTATGKKNLGGKATGTLTVYNYWDSNPQSFGVGTKFSSSSKTYLAKSKFTVPGTSIKGGSVVPGTSDVDIEAESPGDEYNIKAGRFTIVGLPALSQEKIYGQSNKDLSGGFTKEVTVVSETDFDKGKEKLSQELSDSLKKKLDEETAGKVTLDKAILNEVVEAKSSAAVDSEASDFTLNVSQRLRVMVFDEEGFDKFIFEICQKEIPSDKMLSLGPNDSIISQVKGLKYDQNLLDLQVAVSAKMSTRVETEKVKQNLLGKNKANAENYLNSLSGVSGFDILYSPTWWLKRISKYPKNLNVELEYIPIEGNQNQ